MIPFHDVWFGDKKMKTCWECGKRLGILQGYYHPVMGREYFVCGTCLETVSESVEKYQEFISPYSGFFNRETTTIEDIKKIEAHLINNIKKVQSRVSSLRNPLKTDRNADGTASGV